MRATYLSIQSQYTFTRTWSSEQCSVPTRPRRHSWQSAFAASETCCIAMHPAVGSNSALTIVIQRESNSRPQIWWGRAPGFVNLSDLVGSDMEQVQMRLSDDDSTGRFWCSSSFLFSEPSEKTSHPSQNNPTYQW